MGFKGFEDEDDIQGQIEAGIRDAPTPKVAPAQTAPEAPTTAPKPEGDTSQPTATQEPPQAKPDTTPKDDGVTDDWNIKDQLAAIPLGVADFGFDLARVAGFKELDDKWDAYSARNTNPWIEATRNLAGVVIPSIVADKVTKGLFSKVGAKALPKLGSKTKFWANAARAVGTDTAVAAISSQTEEGGNMGNFMNDVFGTNVPWAVTDDDSPDATYAKNLMDNVGIAGGVELIAGFFGRFKPLKSVVKIFRSSDGKEIKPIADGALYNADGPTTAALKAGDTVKANQIAEGVDALKKDPLGEKGYNPYLNTPAEDVAKPAQSMPVDPIGARVDNARIMTNTGTVDGMMRPVTTPGQQKAMADVLTNEGRRRIMDDISIPFSEKISAFVGDAKLTEELIDKEAANLRAKVFQLEPNEVEDYMQGLLTTTINGQFKTLGEVEFSAVESALRESLSDLLNPSRMNASAFVTQEAASNASIAAKAARIVGDFANSESQGAKVLQNLHIMQKELRFNQFISGSLLNNKKIIQNFTPAQKAAYMAEKGAEISAAYAESAAKSKVFFDELTKINKENPEMLKPFFDIFEATKGDANTLGKMVSHLEQRYGFLGKAVIDKNPKVASFLVKEIESIRYNSVLFGKAVLNAGFGNGLNLALKPMSQLAGSLIEGGFKENMFVYGGFVENWQRGFQAFTKDWNLVTSDPSSLARTARPDLARLYKDNAEFEATQEAMKALYNSGDKFDLGRVAAYNVTNVLSNINKSNIARFGVNAMTALDGLTKGINASWSARRTAYRELSNSYGKMSAADFKVAFNNKQGEIYSQAFDVAGNMTDKAAEFAAKEMTLQLDNGLADSLTNMMDKFPVMKPIFMFPRTGVNALDLAWTYTPTSNLMAGVGRASKVFRAETPEQIVDVLAEHGIKEATAAGREQALMALKSDYRGRQMMGSAVLMGAAMLALNGELRGSGPRDQAEARRMRINLEWEPYTIKSPLDGKWYSYKQFEPFSKILGLVADFTYESTRVDEQIMEGMFHKLAYSITSNVTSSTFLSGIEPLAKIIGGDFSQFQKMAVREVDLINPLPRGLRSILNDVIAPQVFDVEQDFLSQMKKQNKFLFGPAGQLDQYNSIMDGKPINYLDPINATLAIAMPFFKVNGDQSPQQDYLTQIAWTGLSAPRTDKITQKELSPQRRQWVNNWIAENAPLNPLIDEMMARDAEDGAWIKDIRQFKKYGQGKAKKDWQIKQILQHRILNDHMNQAYTDAFNALALEDTSLRDLNKINSASKKALNRSDLDSASKLADDAKNLLNMNK
tara:strand:- start:361 stop:4251 length:3891 start_codon:yes stop_codon:yes gene_type:complete